MKWLKWIFLTGLLSAATLQASFAADAKKEPDSYAYYGFEPDIVTNFINKNKQLGYIRVAIELRVAHQSQLDEVEHNAPLLRDAIIEILGSQDRQEIISLTGRERIREQCLKTINNLLRQETGEQNVVADILFTKYLYQ
ncbi:flagellar basal body-associated protein FliL [Celerinatantimonas yamalensis]|uniref:Flagellar protein FliL n=1 Tax=Celerinatantimonas yamalensis TaxID=559956 RepID=A0ABW9G987_9GAMM